MFSVVSTVMIDHQYLFRVYFTSGHNTSFQVEGIGSLSQGQFFVGGNSSIFRMMLITFISLIFGQRTAISMGNVLNPHLLWDQVAFLGELTIKVVGCREMSAPV